MEHLRTKEGGVRWDKTEEKRECECELQRYGQRERERERQKGGGDRERVRVPNIIELKRWSRAISKQVGVWSEKEQARY